MNFIKRSFLSVKARKGKSLLQVFVFSVICVLVLAGLSIQTAAKKSSDLARQKLGADVTLQVDMEKMREQMQAQQSNGERRKFQPTPITVETAEELTSYEQIKGYNFYSSTTAIASNFEPIINEKEQTIPVMDSGFHPFAYTHFYSFKVKIMDAEQRVMVNPDTGEITDLR